MVTRRPIPLQRRLRMYAGPMALGVAWTCAAALAATLGWLQHASGTTTALAVTRTHELRAPESGWVVEVSAKPGTAVEAGATLARLEVPGMAQDLIAAEARVRAAEEGIVIDQSDRNRRFTKEVEGSRRALLSAQVALAGQRGQLAQAEAELNRLSTEGVATATAEVARAGEAISTLNAALQTREEQVRALEMAFHDARARASVTVEGDAPLAEAMAQRDALLARLSSSELKATTSGIIGPLVPTPSEWTTAGSPLVTITEPVSNEVVAYVAVPFARGLHAGAAVDLLPDGGSSVRGVIALIGPAAVPIPDALHPPAPTWAMPVHIVTEAMLVPGETVGVDL